MNKAISLVFGLLVSTSAFSHDAKPFIEKFLQDLDKNTDVSGYFVERPQFIFGHHIHIPDSSTEAGDYVQDLHKKLVEQGYAKSIIENSKILAHIEDYELVTLTLNRLKTDGKVLDKVCTTYGIVHLKFGYRILSWQPSQPNKKGECW